MTPLVSIVIPTYNRFNMLPETLDSIINQTYENWECIIVDDRSTDNSISILEQYVKKDKRIHYSIRPSNKKKGATTCRNIGFKNSQGNFIQFFDSDDIMLPTFLEKKVKELSQDKIDFVISQTQNFIHPNVSNKQPLNKSYYSFETVELTHFNYCTQKVNWLTPDFMVKREFADKLTYNESLPSGQEYNFLCKLTAHTVRCVVIKEVLTLRRMHDASIKSTQARTNRYLIDKRLIYYENWRDLNDINLKKTYETQKFFFEECVNLSLEVSFDYSFVKLFNIFKNLIINYSFKTGFYYAIYQIVGRTTGRGHFIRKKFTKAWKKNI